MLIVPYEESSAHLQPSLIQSIEALSWMSPSAYTIDDLARLTRQFLSDRIRGVREGSEPQSPFRPIREHLIQIEMEHDIRGYTPPRTNCVITLRGVLGHWRADTGQRIKKELGAIDNAFRRKDASIRVYFRIKGSRQFPIESRYTVPLSRQQDRHSEHFYQLNIPPVLTDQERKMLRNAGVPIRVGWHKGDWVLHLNNEDHYLYARMLF